jgi:hypothetical protein
LGNCSTTGWLSVSSMLSAIALARIGGMMQPQRRTPKNGWSLKSSTEKLDTLVAELVSFLQALKIGSLIGYLILLALVPIGLALIMVGLVHQRIVIERFQTASKATQENFETIAADLRKRAMEVKKHDEGVSATLIAMM